MLPDIEFKGQIKQIDEQNKFLDLIKYIFYNILIIFYYKYKIMIQFK